MVVEAMMVLVILNRGGESGEMCMDMALKWVAKLLNYCWSRLRAKTYGREKNCTAERERVRGTQQFSRNEGGEEADYAILHIG